jgi:hypothetical protein
LLEDGGRKVGQGKKKRVRGWGWWACRVSGLIPWSLLRFIFGIEFFYIQRYAFYFPAWETTSQREQTLDTFFRYASQSTVGPTCYFRKESGSDRGGTA